MLTPALKALNGLKTVTESLEDNVYEGFLVRNELDPEVLNIRSDLAVLLNNLIITTIFIIVNFFFLFTLNDFFDLKMGKKVEVLLL